MLDEVKITYSTTAVIKIGEDTVTLGTVSTDTAISLVLLLTANVDVADLSNVLRDRHLAGVRDLHFPIHTQEIDRARKYVNAKEEAEA